MCDHVHFASQNNPYGHVPHVPLVHVASALAPAAKVYCSNGELVVLLAYVGANLFLRAALAASAAFLSAAHPATVSFLSAAFAASVAFATAAFAFCELCPLPPA